MAEIALFIVPPQTLSGCRRLRVSGTRRVIGILAHETCHWSGGKARLDRDLGHRFGSEAYAVEELVAELGAAFICADLELGLEARADHADYIASWLKVL